MKAEPVYFVDDDQEPRELEDLGDGLAMRTPQDPGEPESMAYHTMDPQKNLELEAYFSQTQPKAYSEYEYIVKNYSPVPGYEDESDYELSELKEALDPSNEIGLDKAVETYKFHRAALEAPEPSESEPFGYFELSGQPYKLINREWRMLGEDGEPLSPGEQYRRQAGMFTGKGPNGVGSR